MAARVSAALRLKSEAAGRLGLQRASRTRSFDLYRDRAWRGRPRADRRSVGVRFDTEPEEEEGDADVWARFVSETERERWRAAAAGARGLTLRGCWASARPKKKAAVLLDWARRTAQMTTAASTRRNGPRCQEQYGKELLPFLFIARIFQSNPNRI